MVNLLNCVKKLSRLWQARCSCHTYFYCSVWWPWQTCCNCHCIVSNVWRPCETCL